MSFIDAPSTFNLNHLFVSIEGEEKTGKTHLALTIAQKGFTTGVIDLNDGLGGVIDKRVREIGKGWIKVAKHPIPDGVDKAAIKVAATREWAEMRPDLINSLKSNRATVVDSGTEIWLLSRQSEFGDAKTESKKGSLDYEAANSKVRGLYRLYHAHPSHLIITHQLDDEWKGQKDPNTGQIKNVRSGRRKLDGFKEIPFMVQVRLRTDKGITDTGLHVVATLTACRFSPQLEGTEFSSENGMFDLPFIFGFITDTDRETWLNR